mmetsp:Transcript_17052/g.34111  ORF Transcript_17052/g.34111 Transcript_17052/m.34111 type:complete len:316 (-) Transcript_17052:1691-2638(-)
MWEIFRMRLVHLIFLSTSLDCTEEKTFLNAISQQSVRPIDLVDLVSLPCPRKLQRLRWIRVESIKSAIDWSRLLRAIQREAAGIQAARPKGRLLAIDAQLVGTARSTAHVKIPISLLVVVVLMRLRTTVARIPVHGLLRRSMARLSAPLTIMVRATTTDLLMIIAAVADVGVGAVPLVAVMVEAILLDFRAGVAGVIVLETGTTMSTVGGAIAAAGRGIAAEMEINGTGAGGRGTEIEIEIEIDAVDGATVAAAAGREIGGEEDLIGGTEMMKRGNESAATEVGHEVEIGLVKGSESVAAKEVATGRIQEIKSLN